jgi:hypothetical protein
MYNIAIIGAGQLGRRHLQGLLTARLDANIYVVDPGDSALAAAHVSVAEVQSPATQRKAVKYAACAADFPRDLDLAIVATTADVRLQALQSLCKAAAPRNLVLEKVLFQRASDYQDASDLIERHKIAAWVNCGRRMLTVYQNLREFFADDPVSRMEVFGGEWGLGCNGIHFLDLLQFLSGTGDLSIDTEGLVPGVLQSKRPGFVEFAGSLRGSIGNAGFQLTSIAGSKKRHLISLHASGSKSVFIDEARCELWKHTGGTAELERFSLPYQSQMTGALAEQILETGDCALTPYLESAALHLPFLDALGRHAAGADGNVDCCSIT